MPNRRTVSGPLGIVPDRAVPVWAVSPCQPDIGTLLFLNLSLPKVSLLLHVSHSQLLAPPLADFSLTRPPKHEEPIGFSLNFFKGSQTHPRSPIPPAADSQIPLASPPFSQASQATQASQASKASKATSASSASKASQASQASQRS